MGDRSAVSSGAGARDAVVASGENIPAAWFELRGHARHFFQTPEWIQSLAPRVHADVLLGALREGPRVVATSIVERRVRRVAGINWTILSNVWADGLIDPQLHDQITLAEATGMFGRWDVLNLRGLRAGSPWLALADSSKYVRLDPGRGVSILDTSTPFEERWAKMSKNLRGSIRTARNRIEARGGATFRVAIHDDVPGAFDQYVALEAAGWKSATGGTLEQRSWMRDVWREYLLRSETAQVRMIHIDGRLAAALFGTSLSGAFTAHKVAYDERFSTLSPGSVLWADLVESCCADPAIRRIDCVGWYPWHDRWGVDREEQYSLLAFADGSRGRIAEAARLIRRGAKGVKTLSRRANAR